MGQMNRIDQTGRRGDAVEVTGVPPASWDPALAGSCTLDHDGCVVCSDAGIPVRVLAVEGDDAVCEDSAGNRATIAVELVAPARAGDVLLTHGGVAIGRVSVLIDCSREPATEVAWQDAATEVAPGVVAGGASVPVPYHATSVAGQRREGDHR